MPKRPLSPLSPSLTAKASRSDVCIPRDGQRPLPAAFFRANACVVARGLIGSILVHRNEDGVRAGRIVETEAYDETDAASHSFRGPTPRTQVMFGPGGYAYVYRSYGLHWCINVSCGPDGFGAAVLLRAVQPLGELAHMAEARGLNALDPMDCLRLCRGPGNLTQAFGLDHSHNGQSMRTARLGLYRGLAMQHGEHVVAGPRIGISVAQDVPWRFYIAGCPYVSGRRGRRVTASHLA